MKIGILIIATNKYTKFIDPLVESINKYFLPEHEKQIFCFTNKMDEIFKEINITKIYQEHKEWPFITLGRYETFYKNKEYYDDVDVLYYLDADMLIHDYVGEEIIPKDKDLLAVIHPEYFRDKIQTFERNPQSLACVDYDHHVYHCGGVQGGKKESYLKVCEILMNNINTDLKNDIVAANFDESHWNKYLIDHPDSYTELNYNYCYPENWTLDIPKKILVIIKNHGEMRS